MKKGKIILGAAAALVTVGSSLAFKVAHKFSGGALVYANTANNSPLICPVTCNSLRTISTGGAYFTTCVTVGGNNIGIARNAHTFFRAIVGANRTCSTPKTLLQKAP